MFHFFLPEASNNLDLRQLDAWKKFQTDIFSKKGDEFNGDLPWNKATLKLKQIQVPTSRITFEQWLKNMLFSVGFWTFRVI